MERQRCCVTIWMRGQVVRSPWLMRAWSTMSVGIGRGCGFGVVFGIPKTVLVFDEAMGDLLSGGCGCHGC